MAILWCAQNCPDGFADGAHVTWISKTDVASAMSRGDFKTQAEFAQVALAERFEMISVDSHLSQLHKFGNLWSMVGRFLLRKRHSSFKEDESLEEILKVYDKVDHESSGSGGLTPCPGAGQSPCADIQDSIKAQVAGHRAVALLVDEEEALLYEAGRRGVHIKAKDAKLLLLKAKRRRGRGSIIL
jgi:hypothetical protein